MREIYIDGGPEGKASGLREQLDKTCLSHGFDYATLGVFGVPDATAFAVTTYPQEWVTYYQENNFHLHDPAIHLTVQSPGPIDWSIAKQFDKAGVFTKFNEFGLGNHGVTIPIKGGHGEIAQFSVSKNCTDELWAELMETKLQSLEEEAIRLHQIALKAWNISTKYGFEKLAGRQTEILQLVASGQSAKEISRTLSLSHRTVENHLAHIRVKLKVLNTHQAVARAIGLKMIYPV